MEDTALAQLAADKVVLGRQLMGNLKDLLHIEGVRRIEQQIRRETENLQVAITNRTLTPKVLNASKLLHLECLVKILLKCRGLTSVDYVLPVEESDTDPMRVDIVCENGACSVNVEAKNLQMLTNSLNDAGHRILNQAQEFVEAATSNPEVPKPPQMCLIFDNELDQGQTKPGMDDSLLEFVNSIVDQSDRQFELHLNNASQSEQPQTGQLAGDTKQSRRIVYIRENEQKSAIKSEDEPARKYQKRNSDTDQLLSVEVDAEDVQRFKTEGVFDIVQHEEEEPHTVVVMEQVEEQNSTYTDSHNYFCDSCKESGLAYEQEILRLREELKQKDSIINSLKSLIRTTSPASNVTTATRIILPGGASVIGGVGN